MRIAVDGLGGDQAPSAPVLGGLWAAHQWDLEIALVGPPEPLEAEVRRAVAAHRQLARAAARLTIAPASQVIEPDEAPVRALRRKRDSSLVVGIDLVKTGRAQALVSAGSTGALMAGGLLELGRIPGLDRPALPAVVPTLRGPGTVLLDVGANPEARPEHLLQFAVMGSMYAETVLGRSRPTVGLVNIGSEPTKGPETYRAAYRLLAASELNFVGNVEARELPLGAVDVLVCDGFTGNVLLKHTEGLATGLFQAMREELGRRPLTRLGGLLVRPGVRSIRRRMDYREYGGLPLLGLDGVIIKCHGSSDALALKNGIRAARAAVEQGLVERLRARFGGGGARGQRAGDRHSGAGDQA